VYRGELVYTFLYDLGGEVRLGDVARLLASVPAAERVEPSKSAPPYMALVQPLTFRYPDRLVATDVGPKAFRVHARVYAIGAVSIVLRLPFEEPTLDAVAELANLRGEDQTLEEAAHEFVEVIESRLQTALVERYDAPVEPEGYLAIVLTETPRPALELFEKERQTLAGLVAGERRPERLSEEEVKDNLRAWFRYYEDDLVVVDWDRALVIEPTGKFDDVLTVMEVANLELLELRAYDRYLDTVLERAYEDLTRFYGRGGLFRSARNVQEELSNARIDLVRVTDSINNIGKIFGDYYLAKLHVGLTERFHLHEWETIVREKMATLNELYVLASHEVEHRRGLALEFSIVLLFVADIVLIWLVSR
jgi:hypothetical protein